MQPGTLGALAGFTGALITLGVPLVGYLYRIDRRSQKAYSLITGDDEIEDDGVLSRLREVEQRSVENRVALNEQAVEVPDLSEDAGGVRGD